MKPFLILQARPEAQAADDEFAAILDKCALPESRAIRIRLDLADVPESFDLAGTAGVIIGGGPGCVSDPPARKTPEEARIEARALRLMPRIIAADHPFLGCCYGLGILAHHLGGQVSQDRFGEDVGAVTCEQTPAARADPLLSGLPAAFDAFVGHKEAVQALPPGCAHLLRGTDCPIQMIRHGRNVYATQFHPEAEAGDFERRIRIYRDRGYFPPADADRLIALCHAADVTTPREIMRRFAARYG